MEAFHVSIDEEATSPVFHAFEMEQARNTHSDPSQTCGIQSKFTPLFWVVLALLVVTVVCALAIPLTLLRVNQQASSLPLNSPSVAPTFPYPCYTSTLDILQAQRTTEGNLVPYIICPDTTIHVGTFKNPVVNDFRFVDGDYPIMVIRENVTIQCGLNGRQENNCAIESGFMHVLIMQRIPLPDGSILSVKNGIDNLLVRGITFTGTPDNVGPFNGNSVSIGHPGKNLRFEDCLWTNVVAQSGLIGIYRNYYQVLTGLPLADRSIEVTFSDCTFKSIVYDHPLIHNVAQMVTLDRCNFRDIQLAALTTKVCLVEYSDGEIEYHDGCAGLLYCSPNSSCFLNNTCVNHFDYQGPGIVVAFDETELETDGLYLAPPITQGECELAIVNNFDAANTTCETVFKETLCPLKPLRGPHHN